MKKAILGLSSAIVLSGCGANYSAGVKNASDSQIVGGKLITAADLATGGRAESVVFIQTRSAAGGSVCSGTLIGRSTVLTAGHCIPAGVGASDVIVVSRLMDATVEKVLPTDPKPAAFRVAALISHPDWLSMRSSRSDLAVLKLASEVPETMKLATLPSAKPAIADFSAMTAFGYGRSNDLQNATSDERGVGKLRSLTLVKGQYFVLPSDVSIPPDMRGMIASDARVSSFCHGDSGGPVMVTSEAADVSPVIYGVMDRVTPAYQGQQGLDYKQIQSAADLAAFYVKYPDAKVCAGGPNLSVNVADHLDWIKETAQTLKEAAGF